MGALRKGLIDKVKSGHAQATSVILKLRLNAETESGMDLRLFGGKMVRLQLQHTGYLFSDAEAQRATFNLRGAAGIKPCVRCKNIVAKAYASVDHTGFFHEINCAQFSQLIIASDTEIFSAIDQLATITSKKDWNNWRNHLVSISDLMEFGMILLYEIGCLQAMRWEILCRYFGPMEQ